MKSAPATQRIETTSNYTTSSEPTTIPTTKNPENITLFTNQTRIETFDYSSPSSHIASIVGSTSSVIIILTIFIVIKFTNLKKLLPNCVRQKVHPQTYAQRTNIGELIRQGKFDPNPEHGDHCRNFEK